MKANNNRGWRLLLIKVIIAVLLVFIIENIADRIVSTDATGISLIPFHNHYFSFSKFYLTEQGLGSEFSSSPSATLRFVIYALFGYLIYALGSILAGLIPGTKKYSGSINTILFTLFLAGSFLLALFIPNKLSIIDRGKEEIRVTGFKYWFAPTTIYIPFNQIREIDYHVVPVYDGYNKVYINYLVIDAARLAGTKTELGAIEAGRQKGTLVQKPVTEISPGMKAIAANAVNKINELIKLGK